MSIEFYRALPKTLWADPPLSGKLERFPLFNAVVCGEEKHLMTPNVLYVNGARCSSEEFSAMLDRNETVNFEALKSSTRFNREWIYYKVNIAWVGEKPSLTTFAGIDSERVSHNKAGLNGNETYVGIVRKIYLPNIALIQCLYDKEKPWICYRQEQQDTTEEGEESAKQVKNITDYVNLHGFVEFTVEFNKDCPFGVCARGVRMITKNERELYLQKKGIDQSQKKAAKSEGKKRKNKERRQAKVESRVKREKPAEI